MQRWRRSSSFWWWAGIGVLGLTYLSKFFPTAVEQWYSRGVFLLIRWLFDTLLTWQPLPVLYFLVLALLSLAWRSWRRAHFAFRGASAGPIWGQRWRTLANACGALVFFFFLLWGWHYQRVPLEDQLALQLRPVTFRVLKQNFRNQTERIVQLRKSLPQVDTGALEERHFPPSLESDLRDQLEGWLRQNNFPTVGRVRARLLFPRGVFLRFSTAGLYLPFTGEGHVDAGLHPLQWPYVMTHEMAHGYGFADEGTCNFLAYVAGRDSPNPVVQYAIELSFWRTLAAQYRGYDPQGFRRLREALPRAIQADLEAINNSMVQYPDLIPHLQYRVYDAYLKSQGISEGMLNYDRVVVLVQAWRRARQS